MPDLSEHVIWLIQIEAVLFLGVSWPNSTVRLKEDNILQDWFTFVFKVTEFLAQLNVSLLLPPSLPPLLYILK